MAPSRKMTVETADGRYRSVTVVPDEEVEWSERAEILRLKGTDRRLELTGELWRGGPLYGGESVALVERIEIRGGEARARYSVARWLP